MHLMQVRAVDHRQGQLVLQMPSVDTKPAFWSQSIDALAGYLNSRPGGLSSAHATALLKQVGPNSLEKLLEPRPFRLLLRQFNNPLVLILAIGAGVALVLREWIDAAIILAIVLGSSLLGFVQEYRASTVVQKLKNRLALTARVLRDGVERTVPARTIVPGDVILLSAGNLIPADGLVMEAEDFLVSEASLTGESFPVEKRPGVLAVDTPVARRTNAVRYAAARLACSPSRRDSAPSTVQSRRRSRTNRRRPISPVVCGGSATC